MSRALVVLGLLALAGCRTEIRPLVKETPAKIERMVPGECRVRDYPSAPDVPEGAENIGWVKVPHEKTDEETFEKLREAVCAKGGNAFSQAHWIREAGASIADQPTELEANAWLVPVRR
ncbi:MAG: hypothetical protein IT380_04545 [Myxococcales bacterium]|nr:hypothetical protein [Myxococcales bacterium]